MIELLKRWAELEPERCRPQNGFICGLLVNGSWREVHYDTKLSREKPMVQWAVQEAIAARGWGLELKRESWTGLLYEAFISRDKINGFCKVDDPAEALLVAYLMALESEG